MIGHVFVLLPTLVAGGPASAQEIVLRNDTNYDDTYEPGESVIWLEFPECAITVLTPEPDEYPLEIHTIEFFFVSNTGNLQGESGYTELGIQIIDEGAAPTGRGSWAWGEEAFLTTASDDSLNRLSLVDDENDWEAITLTEGSLAVWMCPTDPVTGADWPYNNNSDVTGIVVDGGSPSTHNYVFYSDAIYKLKDLGVSGSWVIRAIAGEDTGGSDGGSSDGGGSDGGGESGDDGGDGVFVDSITPSSVMEGESTTVAIVGEGFDDDATAFVGGLAVSSVSVSGGNALTGTLPSALPVGVHDVMVSNPSGGSDTLAAGFTVLSAEEVDGGGGCGCGGGSQGALLLLFGPLAWARTRRPREA